MTYFSLKSTPMNSDLKYGDKTFFPFCPFPVTTPFDGSPGTYEASKNSQKFHTYSERNWKSLSVTLFNLAVLVRS
jgi:hypothetical protein